MCLDMNVDTYVMIAKVMRFQITLFLKIHLNIRRKILVTHTLCQNKELK